MFSQETVQRKPSVIKPLRHLYNSRLSLVYSERCSKANIQMRVRGFTSFYYLFLHVCSPEYKAVQCFHNLCGCVRDPRLECHTHLPFDPSACLTPNNEFMIERVAAQKAGGASVVESWVVFMGLMMASTKQWEWVTSGQPVSTALNLEKHIILQSSSFQDFQGPGVTHCVSVHRE